MQDNEKKLNTHKMIIEATLWLFIKFIRHNTHILLLLIIKIFKTQTLLYTSQLFQEFKSFSLR